MLLFTQLRAFPSLRKKHCMMIHSIQARVWSSSIFSLMQNLCKTTMRFSPQRETWRSMARRKSSFTPLVIPRVTVWCLKPWRRERQTKSSNGYLVHYSNLKGAACHLLYIYCPYPNLYKESQIVHTMLFLKNRVFSSLQVFQQLEVPSRCSHCFYYGCWGEKDFSG